MSIQFQALQWGASLAKKYEARLLLLYVIAVAVDEVYPQGVRSMSPTPFYYEGMAPGVWIRHPIILEFEETMQAELHAFARKALQEPVPVQVKVAVGKPAEEILRVAREERVDLIVMGTHGRTGLRQLLLGSVTEAVARYAPCPVFTVRIGVEVVVVQGRDLFLRYCAACHGDSGKGDGLAAATLQPPPADLTRLRERYGDTYPLRQTLAAIDGRRPVRAHGDSAMPVWGQIFEREMEERKIGWPKATTLQRERLIAEYVLRLQQ